MRLFLTGRFRPVLFASAILSTMVCALTVSAASSFKPGSFYLLPSGKKWQLHYVEAVNSGPLPVTLTVTAEYWAPAAGTPPLEQWFHIRRNHLVLGPKEKGIFDFEVHSLPIDREVLVMLYMVRNNADLGSLLQVRVRQGIPCYAFFGSTRRPSLTLERLEKDRSGRGGLRLAVRNTGNIHLAPFGDIIFREAEAIVWKRAIVFEKAIFPGETVEKIVDVRLEDLARPLEVMIFFQDPYDKQPSVSHVEGKVR